MSILAVGVNESLGRKMLSRSRASKSVHSFSVSYDFKFESTSNRFLKHIKFVQTFSFQSNFLALKLSLLRFP